MNILTVLAMFIAGITGSFPVHPSHQTVPKLGSNPSAAEHPQAAKNTAVREKAAYPKIMPYVNGNKGFAIKNSGNGKYLCARSQNYYKKVDILIEADGHGNSKNDEACQFKMTPVSYNSNWVNLQLLTSNTFLAR